MQDAPATGAIRYVPNALTVLRLCALPVIVYLYGRDVPGASWTTAIVILIAALSDVAGKKITTIEAVADGSDRVGAAVHAAWIKHDVAQCGYCQSGQIMSATAFLKSLPKGKQPSAADIDAAMSGNICRCGTYARIRAAVADAAKALA